VNADAENAEIRGVHGEERELIAGSHKPLVIRRTRGGFASILGEQRGEEISVGGGWFKAGICAGFAVAA
jgi:hypothetical protein